MADAPATTTLNRGWVLKMAMFLAAAIGIGIWGLLDATVFYPKGGEADASLQLKVYLEKAKDAGRLTQTKVADPRKDLAELTARKAELLARSPDVSMAGKIAAMELAKLDWLESLKRLWRLDSATTRITDPDKQLTELTAEWKKKPAPKPLSPLDLGTQWVITAIGFLLGLWVLGVLLVSKAKSAKFRWDAPAQRLTLPNGASFTPADLRELDKRKWHKYFVTVHTKDGAAHKLDLLRYSPLEDWVLEMERTAFPEAAAAAAAAASEGNAAAEPA